MDSLTFLYVNKEEERPSHAVSNKERERKEKERRRVDQALFIGRVCKAIMLHSKHLPKIFQPIKHNNGKSIFQTCSFLKIGPYCTFPYPLFYLSLHFEEHTPLSSRFKSKTPYSPKASSSAIYRRLTQKRNSLGLLPHDEVSVPLIT